MNYNEHINSFIHNNNLNKKFKIQLCKKFINKFYFKITHPNSQGTMILSEKIINKLSIEELM